MTPMPEYSLPVAYLFIVGAVTFETIAAVFLRYSDGFKKPVPTALTVVSFIIVFFFGAEALTVLPLSVGYPIWAGGCAVSTGVVGVLAFKEKRTMNKFVGIALVVAGIVILDSFA